MTDGSRRPQNPAVTSTEQQLTLRPPLWAQVWVVVFFTVFAAINLSGVIPLRGDPNWGARIFLCLFGVVLGWRLFRLAAIGTSDGRLVVRNHWRDRTLHRDDVADVVVGRVLGGSNRSVQLRLRDGSTVRLDVTEVPFSSRRLERQAARVREWVEGRPQPFR